VLEIMSLDRLYVSAPIDERDAARLAPGLPARVTIDTYPGVVWDGQLARVAPLIEEAKEQNRTIEVEVDLPLVVGKPQPRPGMTADVEIVLDRRDTVLRVPTFAVTEGQRVLVVEAGRAVSREVSTGVRNWQWTEVRSGLAEGQTVITSLDRAGLKAGSAVRASPAASPAKPPSDGNGPTAGRERGP
jgi:HlyD family secretion protein